MARRVRASPRAARVVWRVPLLAVGLLSMGYATWLGLIRLGWRLPLPQPDQLIVHGPLMICGFLGTLIGLERAVGLRARWGYAAPVLTASGAVLVAVGALPSAAGPALITGGSAVVIAIFVVVCRRQPALFAITMLAGAVAWFAGNVQWLGGAAVFRVVFWWLAFLVLTIAGERLELNRMLRPTRAVQIAFAGAIVLIVAGVVTAVGWPEAGARVLGAGLVALTIWLSRNDIARRTVGQRGLTGFMAICLLGGYAWLAVGGLIALSTGAARPGYLYDATLHAVFLGFVMSMVFAHAPVIFPAVLGRPLEYRPAFYAHVAVLHASVAVRLAGDLVEDLGRLRAWGGLLSALALAVFLVNTIRAILLARSRPDQPHAFPPAS